MSLYLFHLSRRLMDHTLLLLTACPSGRGWIKWCKIKLWQGNMEIYAFISSCQYSQCIVDYVKKENDQNSYQDLKQQQERNKLSDCEDADEQFVSLSTTQASVIYVLKRPTPRATCSIQAVQKRQSKSQITRDTALRFLHHQLLVPTLSFLKPVKKTKVEWHSTFRAKNSSPSHALPKAHRSPLFSSSNLICILRSQHHSPHRSH